MASRRGTSDHLHMDDDETSSTFEAILPDRFAHSSFPPIADYAFLSA